MRFWRKNLMYSLNIIFGWILLVIGFMDMSTDNYMAIMMFIMAKLFFIHADIVKRYKNDNKSNKEG